MTITILEVLYLVLIIFATIIGTLLTLILIRVLKILGPVMEIINTYNKVKKIINIYASIPGIVVDWVKNSIISIIKKDN